MSRSCYEQLLVYYYIMAGQQRCYFDTVVMIEWRKMIRMM